MATYRDIKTEKQQYTQKLYNKLYLLIIFPLEYALKVMPIILSLEYALKANGTTHSLGMYSHLTLKVLSSVQVPQ
jgi:hypothetical protein